MSDRPILTKRLPPPFADKLRRAIWQVCYTLFFRPSPTPFHGWRRCILRAFGARVGSRSSIYPSAKIWAPWNVKIADNATVGGDAVLYSVGKITIGHAAIVSQGVHLCTASHDHNSENFDLVSAPIEIAVNAWVGAEAFIGPGVTLAEGAVAAARAVVMRAVPERAIVAGNPARVVSERSVCGRNVLVGRAN